MLMKKILKKSKRIKNFRFDQKCRIVISTPYNSRELNNVILIIECFHSSIIKKLKLGQQLVCYDFFFSINLVQTVFSFATPK